MVGVSVVPRREYFVKFTRRGSAERFHYSFMYPQVELKRHLSSFTCTHAQWAMIVSPRYGLFSLNGAPRGSVISVDLRMERHILKNDQPPDIEVIKQKIVLHSYTSKTCDAVLLHTTKMEKKHPREEPPRIASYMEAPSPPLEAVYPF